MDRILLLDGDVFAYTAALCAKRDHKFGSTIIATLDTDSAKTIMDNAIHQQITTMKGDRAVVCMSDPSRRYFRHDLCPDYKPGRDAPTGLSFCKDYLEEHYEVVWKPGLEGDDVMGIIATAKIKKYKGEKIICSSDKDMMTIPGLLCRNPKDPEPTVEQISEGEADWNFLYQTLVGDRIDGYGGCPKVGAISAPKILDKQPDEPVNPEATHLAWLWSNVVATFEKRGLTKDDALYQARLARILRAEDYDFKTQTPILWNPPHPSYF